MTQHDVTSGRAPGRPVAGPVTPIDGGDVVVVGAGLAGLFTALTIAGHGRTRGSHRRVTLVALDQPGRLASSGWAQGGIAAAVGRDDSPAAHAADTCAAGAGLVDPVIAALVAQEIPARIDDLARLGVPFNRDHDGHYALGREAAHSAPRIVRVSGDRAGAVVTQTLGKAVAGSPGIRLLTGLDVVDLIVEDGRAAGLRAQAGPARETVEIRAPHIVLATGGAGALFRVATAPLAMLGAGLGLAARAGARIADPEFVQFHPTAMVLGRDPAPLATEALRGEGAVLTTQSGARFMSGVHRDAELAPRDVVARAVHARLLQGDRVFLDCRSAVGTAFAERFPTVYGLCMEAGLDPSREPIPVAPAAHYHMGGLDVDGDGRTSVPGLWACGEVASTGLHGANRLASNSLAEALVFGARIGGAICGETEAAAAVPDGWSKRHAWATPAGRHVSPVIARLRATMTRHVGLIRSQETLCAAARDVLRLEAQATALPGGTAAYGNAFAAATLIVAAAAKRTESRGGHFRADHPQTDETQALRTRVDLSQARRSLAELADGAAVPVGSAVKGQS